jgi:hypothetical protein
VVEEGLDWLGNAIHDGDLTVIRETWTTVDRTIEILRDRAADNLRRAAP